ncbi:shikimate dehydrogenase [Ruminococcaceae bacterium OttesenSCG-928-I18]|nr:shikimate dehydrogenase [Ruminococcaceae bacterium OttesenSCG-928-I18]
MPFGLVGKSLSHSHSVFLHEALGDRPYSLFSLDEDQFDAFLRRRNFDGINVTIPYKQRVIAYCDEVDETAKEIGAVNTVANREGRLTGYNTDVDGLSYILSSLPVKPQGHTALILGSGGTSHTAKHVLQRMGAKEILVASRSPGPGRISYKEASHRKEIELVINTTPYGMYPNNGEAPLLLAPFPNLHAVVDVVYNPLKTALLLDAERLHLPFVGGLGMLVEQARVSSQLFLGRPQPPERTPRLVTELGGRLINIVLIGMPGCGKSSLGQALAKHLARPFLDLDHLVAKKAGSPPGKIIETQGEAAFRALETQAARQAGRENNAVIATGGGIVLREENIDALRQNGVVIFVDCPVHKLPIGEGRPLSKTRDDLQKLDEQRREKYMTAADRILVYHERFEENLKNLETLAEELLVSYR